MSTVNKHIGSSFDSFLKEEGIFEQTHANALNTVLTELAKDEPLTSPTTSPSASPNNSHPAE